MQKSIKRKQKDYRNSKCIFFNKNILIFLKNRGGFVLTGWSVVAIVHILLLMQAGLLYLHV